MEKFSLEDDNIKERRNSIIDHLKLVVDEKELAKVIERGFVDCKFVREEIKVSGGSSSARTTNKVISREHYLQL